MVLVVSASDLHICRIFQGQLVPLQPGWKNTHIADPSPSPVESQAPKDLPPEAGPSAGSNLEQPLSQPQNMKASVYWWKILSLDDLLDSKSNCENVTEKGTRIGLDKHGNPLVLTMQLKYTASLSLPLNPHMMSFLSVCLYVSFQSMHLWKYIFDKMAENYDYPSNTIECIFGCHTHTFHSITLWLPWKTSLGLCGFHSPPWEILKLFIRLPYHFYGAGLQLQPCRHWETCLSVEDVWCVIRQWYSADPLSIHSMTAESSPLQQW